MYFARVFVSLMVNYGIKWLFLITFYDNPVLWNLH